MIDDYRIYKFTRREKIISFFQGMGFNALIAFLFYDSYLAMIPGILVVILFMKEKKRVLTQKRSRRMREDLKEFFRMLVAAMQTGRSLENAFLQSSRDLWEYLEKETEIALEMKKIGAGISVGEPLEKLLMDFAVRSHLEELEYFAEVFCIARSSGGNLISIMKNTLQMLQEKMDAADEIDTIITEKQLEFYLMCVIPLGIIVYLRIGAAALIGQLYGNFKGITVMTICLVVYGGCYFYGKRILEFEN